MDIKYFKPVKCDVFVKIDLEENDVYALHEEFLHEGKVKYTLNLEIVDEKGTVYGKTSGLYYVFENEDPKPTVKAIKAIKAQEYTPTEIPKHDMMAVLMTMMKVGEWQVTNEWDLEKIQKMIRNAIPMA